MDESPRAARCPELSDSNLGALAGRAQLPRFDRSRLRPGVVHFGVGGFHRAHQAVVFDDLAAGGELDWGIVGVAIHNRDIRDGLAAQDHLYTVVERDGERSSARVVGSLVDVLVAPEDPDAVLRRLADPATKLVTLTITGGAYERSADDERDVFDYIAAGLERRRRDGTPPFAVLSCDNVPANGAAARRATLDAALGRGDGLARWIHERVPFPSSVVDRITPKRTSWLSELVASEFGIADRVPVVTEPYLQWVIEDRFGGLDRPPLDGLGVRFVADTAAYELMKKRLLNGSHCALGYLGGLAGHRTSDEAMGNGELRGYLRDMMDEEVTPLLDPIPGFDLEGYKDTLVRRFSNPGVADRLARLCERGSVKMPSYLLPSVEDALEQGRSPDLLALAVAAWCRYLRGTDLAGSPIDVVDPDAELLGELARLGGADPTPLLSHRSVFGDLGRNDRFAAAVRRGLDMIEGDGIASAIAQTRRAAVPVAA